MSESIKILRGSDTQKILGDVLALCDKFFDQSKWIEVVVSPLSGSATEAQNDQQHVWYPKASTQNPQHTAEEYRGLCKAWVGVPIMCRDSQEYREAYESVVKPMSYEQKIALMMKPLDFPVTRAMNKKQKSEFLDGVVHFLATKYGVTL